MTLLDGCILPLFQQVGVDHPHEKCTLMELFCTPPYKICAPLHKNYVSTHTIFVFLTLCIRNLI